MSLVKDAIADQKIPFICIAAGALALFASFLSEDLEILVAVPIAICGLPIIYGAIVGVVKEHDITADVLVSVAIVASILIGEYDAAAEIAIIMQIGAFLEEATVNHANAEVRKLISMRPETARRISEDGTESVVPVESVSVGDRVRIVPGEVVPVDGTVESGTTTVDNSMLTGESVPVDIAPGDRVCSGATNMYGSIDIVVESIGEDSTLARMSRIIDEADAGRSRIVRTADKWAVWIVVMAFTVAVLAYVFTQDIYRSVTVLVVFCPCALILATPTAIMAASGNMSKRGILVKDGGAVERMASVDVMLMDKTGTVTTGKVSCRGFVSTSDVSEEELAALASSLESRSEHPLGKAIAEHGNGTKDVQGFAYIPGKGVSGTVDGRSVVAGNARFLSESCSVNLDATVAKAKADMEKGLTVVFVGIDGRACGYAVLSDTVKADSALTISSIKDQGLYTIMLTGDCEAVARATAAELEMDDLVWECLPEDKLKTVKSLEGQHRTCMIGDGINDAPTLKRSDVGIAMGGVGNEMATESSDIVFMDDDISKVPGMLKLCRRTMLTIKSGIAFSLILNTIAMVMAVFGLMGPVAGALVHNIGSVIVIIMAAMLLRYDPWSSTGEASGSASGQAC